MPHSRGYWAGGGDDLGPISAGPGVLYVARNLPPLQPVPSPFNPSPGIWRQNLEFGRCLPMFLKHGVPACHLGNGKLDSIIL